MTINNDGAASARCARRPAKLLAGSLALSIGALGAGLAVTAAPAYADVVSGNYTIGGPPWNPSAPVSAVTATPATLNTGTPDSFVVSFTVPTALSGAHANWLSIASSVALGSVPNSIVTSTPGCLQSGTAGVGGAGSSAATGLTIELASTCNISAGSRVQVDFTANAPSAAGSFYFSVTTALEHNGRPLQFSRGRPVRAVFVGRLTCVWRQHHLHDLQCARAQLERQPSGPGHCRAQRRRDKGHRGAHLLRWRRVRVHGRLYASWWSGDIGPSAKRQRTGGAGHIDTRQPDHDRRQPQPDGSGDQPTGRQLPQSNDIVVGPGNGTPQTTNPVIFGTSVSNAAVSASSLAPSSQATYTVSFKAGSGLSAGDYISLGESGGPTNFGTVSERGCE